jgi:hypothetical protein
MIKLGGYGAAFRLSRHLMAGQAVVLQEYEYQEWFAHLLKPWIHYIPLESDLKDLRTKMIWVKENPLEVQLIAKRGRAFYETYLTWDDHEELVHEILYRMSELEHTLHTLDASQQQQEENDRQNVDDTVDGVDEKIENIQIIRATPSDKGFIDDNIELCKVLLENEAVLTSSSESTEQRPGIHFVANDCDSQGTSVLGNHLTRWYMMRLIAKDAGVRVSANCRSSVLDWLPTENVDPAQMSPLGVNFSWEELCKECTEANGGYCVYPHGGKYHDSGLEHSIPTIQAEMQAMANGVLSKFTPELDDVVIHIRTGDIVRQDHELYGLVPNFVYDKYVSNNTQSIGIVTAPFDQERADWGHGDADLNKAVVMSAKAHLERTFPHAKVTIRNDANESIDVVWTRKIVAKLLFCGPSTFCLVPAL